MQRIWYNKTFSSITAALHLIRSADQAGEYHLCCSNTHPYALASVAAHQYELEPSGLSKDAYLDWCLEFCREQKIDIFVPGKGAIQISAQRERFEAQGTRVLVAASPEVLTLLNQKARFYETVQVPMAPPAEFRVVENIEQFDAAWEELRARHDKLCIKPSSSVYGLGFAVIDETRDSSQLLMQGVQYHVPYKELRQGLQQLPEFRTMLLMQFLNGHEYSVDCVGDMGRLVCAVARKKPMKAGHGQLIEMKPEIDAACRLLCETYQLNGNFNVQFRESSHGIGLLEINARMSGGLAMACVAGPNLPYLALRGFDKGFAGLEVPPVRNGIRVSEWSYAVELPGVA
jgi:biotin carboxylase